MAVTVEHVAVIAQLKQRIADDAVTIAMLTAALEQATGDAPASTTEDPGQPPV